jgi:hypothetical protein
MNMRRFQGLSLVLSAVCLLVGHFGPDSTLFHAVALIGTALFIFGIPVIQAVQPTGPIGFAGIVLLELAAVIALVFQLGVISSPSLGGVLGLTSAIAGLAGRLIIGWLTTRKNVFPAWVGWAFIAEGLLNVVGGIFNFGSFANTLSLIVVLLGAAALLGFGFLISRTRSTELSASKP